MSNPPRPNVTATFPSTSEFADFELRIERPRDERGEEVLDRGWDILYEKRDGSAGYNHWADDWNEVLLYFEQGEPTHEAPAWVMVGKFKDAIFPET
jgi:hypothetical protein